MRIALQELLMKNPNLQSVWQCLASRSAQTVWVGGGVRNLLLGLTASDFDLATSLTPDEIVEIAKGNGWYADLVGASFGVVAICCGGETIEVATFRKEGYGDDPHRPAWVEYGASFEEDLSRRDFTINGMALTIEGELFDPFGGLKDLEEQKIRAIGSPVDRFREDALRMLRAVRFAAEFNFSVEEFTAKEIKDQSARVKELSEERITAELEKMWMGSHPDLAWNLLDELGLGKAIFLEAWPGFQEGVEWQRLPAERIFRWALVDRYFSSTLAHLKGLDRKTFEKAKWLAAEVDCPWSGLKTLQRWQKESLFHDSKDFQLGIDEWLAFREAFYRNSEELETIRMEIASLLEKPFFPDQLAISGKELLSIFPEGPKIGEGIQKALQAIQEDRLINQPEAILDFLRK